MKRNLAAAAAGAAAFFLTESYFRKALVPFPETPFAVTAGLGVFFLTRAVFILAAGTRIFRKKNFTMVPVFVAALLSVASGPGAMPVSAAEDGPGRLQARLERILKNQEKILEALEEIKKELKVVKVRASVR